MARIRINTEEVADGGGGIFCGAPIVMATNRRTLARPFLRAD